MNLTNITDCSLYIRELFLSLDNPNSLHNQLNILSCSIPDCKAHIPDTVSANRPFDAPVQFLLTLNHCLSRQDFSYPGNPYTLLWHQAQPSRYPAYPRSFSHPAIHSNPRQIQVLHTSAAAYTGWQDVLW